MSITKGSSVAPLTDMPMDIDARLASTVLSGDIYTPVSSSPWPSLGFARDLIIKISYSITSNVEGSTGEHGTIGEKQEVAEK